MNRETAEKLAQELLAMVPTNVLMYADDSELANKHGVAQKYIDAMHWLDENNESMPESNMTKAADFPSEWEMRDSEQ